MSNIIPFTSGEFSIQVIDIEGEPWFIAKEVADILGYSDTQAMTRRLDDDEKSNRQIVGLGSPTGGRGTTTINEAGLYSAILASTKPEAKPFKRWVTHEVLPAIRRNGGYFTVSREPQLQAAALDASAVHGFLLTIGLDQNAAAISANQVAINLHGVNLLQLSGNTHLLAANQEHPALTPTELGKFMGGMSAQKVNKALEAAGLQKRADSEWVPLPAAEGLYRLFDTGKKHGSGVPVTQLKWFAAAADKLKKAA